MIGDAEQPTSTSEEADATDSAEEMLAKLQERIDRLDAALIEQEHRIPRVFSNLVEHHGKSEGDPRRKASRRALLWSWLAPIVVVGAGTAGGGFFAALTYMEFVEQNATLHKQQTTLERQLEEQIKQNGFFQKQNGFFKQQLGQQAAEDFRNRRANLISTIYDRRRCLASEEPADSAPDCPAANRRSRAVAAIALVEVENAVREDLEAPEDERRYRGVSVGDETNLNGADLVGADLSGADLSDASLSDAKLGSADLSYAKLGGADLSYANLVDADLSHANLFGADLSHADLSGADLRGLDLSSTDMAGAETLATLWCSPDTRRPTTWPEGFKPGAAPQSTDLCNRAGPR